MRTPASRPPGTRSERRWPSASGSTFPSLARAAGAQKASRADGRRSGGRGRRRPVEILPRSRSQRSDLQQEAPPVRSDPNGGEDYAQCTRGAAQAKRTLPGWTIAQASTGRIAAVSCAHGGFASMIRVSAGTRSPPRCTNDRPGGRSRAADAMPASRSTAAVTPQVDEHAVSPVRPVGASLPSPRRRDCRRLPAAAVQDAR